MKSWDVCKNCGGERGLHHYETDQCPVGGREAPIGRKQEWKSTTFEIERDYAEQSELARLRTERDELRAALEPLVKELKKAELLIDYRSDENSRVMDMIFHVRKSLARLLSAPATTQGEEVEG